ncbi:uncharacterized protein METZ01_LOCUS318819, partial [marine metagenome]
MRAPDVVSRPSGLWSSAFWVTYL